MPMPMRPLVPEMYKSGVEVPTMKRPLPNGVEVPMASEPAKVLVAEEEVAMK